MSALVKLVIQTYALRIIWIIAYVVPFFMLPFWWAVFVLFWVAIGGVVGQLFLYSLVKGVLNKQKQIYRDYASGICEAISDIVLLNLIIIKFEAPYKILPIAVALYAINQINRIYKTIRPSEEEVNELIGYAIVFGLYLLFR